METWVLVQNPGAADVTVDLTYMTPAGPVPGPAGLRHPCRHPPLLQRGRDGHRLRRLHPGKGLGRGWFASGPCTEATAPGGPTPSGSPCPAGHLVPGGGFHRRRHGDLGAGAEPRHGGCDRGPDLHDPIGAGARAARVRHPGWHPPLLQRGERRSPTTTSPPWWRHRAGVVCERAMYGGNPHLGHRLHRLRPQFWGVFWGTKKKKRPGPVLAFVVRKGFFFMLDMATILAGVEILEEPISLSGFTDSYLERAQADGVRGITKRDVTLDGKGKTWNSDMKITLRRGSFR